MKQMERKIYDVLVCMSENGTEGVCAIIWYKKRFLVQTADCQTYINVAIL